MTLELPENPLTSDFARFPVSPGGGGGSASAPHPTLGAVNDAAAIIMAVTTELVRQREDARRSRATLTAKFINLTQALYTLIELQNRNAEGLAGVSPTAGQRLVANNEHQDTTKARELWDAVQRRAPEQDPIQRGHPQEWDRQTVFAEQFANLLQGNQVSVTWPGGSQAVNLTQRLQALDAAVPRPVPEEARQVVTAALGMALSHAIPALTRSPRAAQGVAIAREAFTNSATPAGSVLSTLSAAGTAGDKGMTLASRLAESDAAYALVNLSDNSAGRANFMRTQVLEHFARYMVVEDDRPRLRQMFDGLNTAATRGERPSWGTTERQQIRQMVNRRWQERRTSQQARLEVPSIDGTALRSALDAMSWIQLGVALQGPDADATNLGRVAHWGCAVDSGIASVSFLRSGLGLSRAEVVVQTRVLKRVASAGGAAQIFGGIATLLEGAAEVEHGLDVQNDVERDLGFATILSGVMQIIAVACPAAAPFATAVGLGVVAAHAIHDYQEAQIPENLKFMKALCQEALDIRGRGERRMSDIFGVTAQLRQLKGRDRPQSEHAFWRPLCVDLQGRVDSRATTTRGGRQIGPGQHLSFAAEAEAKLRHVFGRGSRTRINALLYGARAGTQQARSTEDDAAALPAFGG